MICNVWLRYGRECESQSTAVAKLNFQKADLEGMKKLFRERNWFAGASATNSEGMLDELLRTYEDMVHKTVPVYKPGTKGNKVQGVTAIQLFTIHFNNTNCR